MAYYALSRKWTECDYDPKSEGTLLKKKTDLDPSLVDAYLETHYIVHADPPFTLRIGEISDPLRNLHRLHGGPSAIITAFNPYSKALSEEENLARQELLLADLLAASYQVIPGIGLHPSNRWPGEPSLLAIGIHAAEAGELGKKYEQNAIVYNDAHGLPELLLLR